MLAIPDEHLLKFHACKDAFGGNKESKKMQKTILKQNYENFAASSQEGLDKTYDSLPSAWNNIALIVRNKYDINTLSMDDLYNNLKVYESEIKGQTSSSSNSQNVTFVSSDYSSSTNEIVNTAHSVSVASSKDQASTASYADDVMFSFFANQSNALELDNEDLEQIDADDLEEMDLKWQMAMLTMRVKRAPRNQGNRNRDAPRRNAPVDTSTTNALVVQDGIGGSDWSFQAEDGLTNFALMAYTSQGSSSSSSSDSKSELNNIYMNASEMVHSVFNSRESDVDDNLIIDRFKVSEGFHAAPHLYTGNYMPPRPDLSFAGLDEYVFKSVVRKTTTSVPEMETIVATKSGQVPVNATKQSSPRASASISTTRPVNTAAPKPKVNDVLPTTYSYFQAQSPVKKPINKRTAVTDINFNKKINTAKVNNVTTAGPKAVVSAAERNGENDVKSSTCWIWRPIGNVIDHISKDIGSYMLKRFDYVDLQGRLNGCSRHMTRNKSFLTDYQEIDDGFVAFGGSPNGGNITGKDSFLPTTFWAKTVNTACYVQNRVLVIKPHNKTSYELLHGRPPSISFMRPFGCPVTILNTLDPLGKFDGKADEGFLVGYFINSKAFRIFNSRTRKVEENLHITFLENKPNVAGSGPDWLFDIDLLTNSMNYELVTAGNQTNGNAEDAVADDAGKKTTKEPANKGERNGQEKEGGASNKKRVSTVSPSISAVGQSFVNADDLSTNTIMPDLEDTTNLLNTGIFSGAYDDEDVGAEADLNNLETTMNVSPIPITRIHKDHPKDQIIIDINSATQTMRMTKISEEHVMVSYINKQRRTNHKDY
ncbi:ribonuclease H-like domain-containing protein [Tanacetum coccineum]